MSPKGRKKKLQCMHACMVHCGGFGLHEGRHPQCMRPRGMQRPFAHYSSSPLGRKVAAFNCNSDARAGSLLANGFSSIGPSTETNRFMMRTCTAANALLHAAPPSPLGLQECMGEKKDGCKHARNAKMHGCKNGWVQKCIGAKMNGCKNAWLQKCRGAKMPGCKDARTNT